MSARGRKLERALTPRLPAHLRQPQSFDRRITTKKIEELFEELADIGDLWISLATSFSQTERKLSAITASRFGHQVIHDDCRTAGRPDGHRRPQPQRREAHHESDADHPISRARHKTRGCRGLSGAILARSPPERRLQWQDRNDRRPWVTQRAQD